MSGYQVHAHGSPSGPVHATEAAAREWMDRNHPHQRYATGYTGYSIREVTA